jgi:hypothetical protein
VTNAIPLVQSLDKLGMPLFGMQTPNGYSWMAGPWVNTGDLVSRMNFALSLSGGRIVGIQMDWSRLVGTAAGVEPTALATALATGSAASLTSVKEQRLEIILLGQPASERTRATVLGQFQDQATQQQAEKSFTIRANEWEPMAQVLNAGGPKQQLRPPQDREASMMAGLLLGSPEFQRR